MTPLLAVHPWLERALTAAAAVAVVWIVYAVVSRALGALGRRARLDAGVTLALRRLLRWIAVPTALILVLQSFGVLQSAMATLTAILAMIAIGFIAVWSVASNVSCSFLMLIVRPIQVGDEISLPPDPIEGTVVNFNMLYTTLRASDGARIQIPNNMFFQRIVRRRAAREPIALDAQLARPDDAPVPAAGGGEEASG